jgi:hypothetical protein
MCLIQIVCLFRQLHFSETPANAAKVSLVCIGQQCVLDALLCIAHLLMCAVLPNLFTAFASVAFFKLVLFIIIELRYVAVISHARDPQRYFAGGVSQLREEWARLHLRFYAALFATLIATYIFQSQINALVFIAYSYLVPQVVTNVIQETREPFHKAYLFGISVTRLAIPLYIYGCPNNLIHTISGEKYATNYTMCGLLVLWTCVQVGVLILQQHLGPHFFIPSRFLPPRYDYSRPLPPQILLVSEESGGNECVICYLPIDIKNAQVYMVTPCDHVFHPVCLNRWMEQKLECPICRSRLPPRPP